MDGSNRSEGGGFPARDRLGGAAFRRESMIKKILDRYHWEARVAPGLILALPILVVAVYAAPFLSSWPIPPPAGRLVLLSFTVGDMSWARAVERLNRSYGISGMDHLTNPVFAQSRYYVWCGYKSSIREALAASFQTPAMGLKSRSTNPDQADKAIVDAFREVRSYLRQRNTDGLWFQHNIEYGFHPNLLACRAWWVVIALISSIVAALSRNQVWQRHRQSGICHHMLFTLLCCVDRVEHLAECYEAHR